MKVSFGTLFQKRIIVAHACPDDCSLNTQKQIADNVAETTDTVYHILGYTFLLFDGGIRSYGPLETAKPPHGRTIGPKTFGVGGKKNSNNIRWIENCILSKYF